MKKVALFLLTSLVASGLFADYYWTGGEGETTDWYDTNNWYNCVMYSGNCVFGGAQKANLSENRLVEFTNRVSITTGLWIEMGEVYTEDGYEVCWTRGDVDEDTDVGLTIGGALTLGSEKYGLAALRISDARIVDTEGDVLLGDSSDGGLLIIENNGILESGSSSKAKWIKLDKGFWIDVEESGTLACWHIEYLGGSSGSAMIQLNGGTLKCLGTDSTNNKYFLGNTNSSNKDSDEYVVEVAFDSYLDVNGQNITINKEISGDATLYIRNSAATAGIVNFLVPPTCNVEIEEGADVTIVGDVIEVKDGDEIKVDGLYTTTATEIRGEGTWRKTGHGHLNLRSPISKENPVNLFIEKGLVTIDSTETPYEFPGSVKFGKQGVLAVKCPAYNTDTPNYYVDHEIELCKVGGIEFEDPTEALADCVVLYGPVFDYRLEYKDGSIYAIVTGVDDEKILSTRKVTCWLGTTGNNAPEGWNWVDQDGAWSNGTPTSNGEDITIYPGDCYMYIWGWYKAWNNQGYNNRPTRRMVLRGGTTEVRFQSAGFPNLDVGEVMGHGTLKLEQIGLQPSTTYGTIIIGEKVAVEISNDGIVASQDTWVKNAVINGAFIATNGLARIYENVTFNGHVYIGAYAHRSYFDRDNIAVNGDFEILEGAEFRFANKTFSVGEDAKLILNGNAATSGLTVTFPTVELKNRAGMEYTPEGGSDYIVNGGVLSLAYDEPGEDKAEILVKGGQLNINAEGTGITDYGQTFEVAGIEFEEGALDLTTIEVTGYTDYSWEFAIDEESGNLVATSRPTDPNAPNRWIGGASGLLNAANNWTRGVPTTDQIIQVDGDAVVLIDKVMDVGTFVVNGNLTFRQSGGDKIHVQGLQGTGTVTLDNAGLSNISGSECIVSNDIVFANGAWLGDYNYSIDMKMYGDLSGSGTVKLWGSSGTYYLYGDNSGFTGKLLTVNGHPAVRFMVPKAGFSSAESVNITGTLWLWFDEGSITFGGLTMTPQKYARGINMPAEARDGDGVKLIVGNNDGAVKLNSGSSNYQAYTRNVNGWTDGFDKFTIEKIGTNTFNCCIENVCNLELEGGETTFAIDNESAYLTLGEKATLVIGETARTFKEVAIKQGAKLSLTKPLPEGGFVLKCAPSTMTGGANMGIILDGEAVTNYASYIDQTDSTCDRLKVYCTTPNGLLLLLN